MAPRFIGLGQRRLHDLFVDAFDLDVHLQRSDTLSRSSHLEVHVAKVVLVAQDVSDDRVAIPLLHKTHGDPSHLGLDRYASVHQRKACATHRGHGGAAVGLSDFRHDPQGVGEVFRIRKHCLHAAAREAAMANFPTLRTTHETRFPNGERREVVMEHEAFTIGAFEGIDDGRVPIRPEGGGHDGLRFPTSEERGPVSLGQHANFHGQRAYGFEITTVDAGRAVDDGVADHGLLEAAKEALHGFAIRSVFTQGFPGELLKALGLKRRHGVLALELIGDAIGRTHGLGEHFSDAVGEGLIDLRRRPLPARLAGFRNERIDRIEHGLHLLVSKEHGAEHLIFRELFCFRFHHKHRLTRTSNGHVEGRGLQRFKARIQQILTIGEAHPSGSEGPAEGDAGDGQSGSGADHGDHIRILVLVGGHHGADDLHFIHKALRKERTDRPVDEPARERFLFRGTALAAEEPTRDFPRGVGFFLVIHGQGEEGLARLSVPHPNHGAQHGGVIHVRHHGPGGLACNFSGF